MMSPLLSFLDLAAPFILAIVLVVAAWRVKDGETEFKFAIPIPFLGYHEMAVKSHALQRVLLGVGIIICLVTPAFRDYSEFFPRHLALQAFFDDAGTTAAVGELAASQVVDLRIATNWPERKRHYFAILNDALQRQGNRFRFDLTDGVVHSVGDTNVEVHKIHGWRQVYQFTRIHGALEHSAESPGQAPERIASEFELLENSDAIVELSWKNYYLGQPVLIMPEFKQVMRVSQNEEIYHHNLVAMTRIDVFPVIDVSRSIYLWTDTDGRRVPIGYAIYTLD